MNLSDEELDRHIDGCRTTLTFLSELRERRYVEAQKFKETLQDPKHGYKWVKQDKKKRITQVKCICGELTKYRVPLNSVTDFKCPQERSNG